VISRLREWVSRLWGTLRPKRNDLDLEQELRLHLELAAEDARRAGGPPELAHRAAAIRSGGLTQAMESLRDQRGLPWLADLPGDLRYACRVLARHPGFTASAVLSLALAIGANTAIFSLINSLMLGRLPVRAPEELVELASRYPGDPRVNAFAWKHYEHFRDGNHVFSDLVGVSPWRFPVSGDGFDTDALDGEYVVGAFFPALGVQPAIGRLIGPQDDHPGAADAAVAVVSWSFWKSRFNLDPAILGKRISVNGVPAAVVGVTPQAFFGLQVGFRTDVWVPVAMEPMVQQPSRLADRSLAMKLVGRLKRGMSIEQARAEMSVLDKARIEEISKASHDPLWSQAKIELVPAGAGFSTLRDQFAKPLQLLMAVVIVLLLIACMNVASLLMARGAARPRELALRVSLGAGRFRLVRQVLTESLLLSVVGSVIGLFLAHFGADALVRILASGRRMVGLERVDLQVQPDVHVLLFTIGVALLTGFLFGLAPAWQALAFVPASSLREAGGAREPRARRLLGQSLVVTQVALSVVLLSAAGLFVRHLSNLRHVDLGFNRDSVLLLTLDSRGSGYSPSQLSSLYRELLGRLQAIPGVHAATVSAITPIEGPAASRFANVEGLQERPEGRRRLSLNWVGPRYFETLGTPWVAGRDFTFEDEGHPPVAIVNQALARYYFSEGGALGKHITFEGDDRPYQIVGVAGDAKYASLHAAAPRTVYLNAFQAGSISQLAVRTSVAPPAVAGDVRRMVRDGLRNVRLAHVTTLADQVDASIVPERLIAALSGLFGALGAALAAIGLYGLLAYTVARRTNEIGVRMALGATAGDVTRMVVKGALGLVSAGLAIGVPIATWSRPLAASMFGNLPKDTVFPIAFGATAMIGVALVAAYVPSRRAARVQPMDALRHE
jgi:putative ABC transport system permease protein